MADEIAKGFQQVGGTANALGVDFEKASSWIATISAKTRESAEQVGVSVKSIMARFQQLREKGYTEDGIDSNQVSKALDKAGIKAIDEQTNQFRNFGTVMDELGAKWGTLDSRTQAYIATTLGGKMCAPLHSNM